MNHLFSTICLSVSVIYTKIGVADFTESERYLNSLKYNLSQFQTDYKISIPSKNGRILRVRKGLVTLLNLTQHCCVKFGKMAQFYLVQKLDIDNLIFSS